MPFCRNCGVEYNGDPSFCAACGTPLTPGSANGNSVSTTEVALPTGTRLHDGRYRVQRVLGHGGFGITYLGMDESLSRQVAIKEFITNGCRREDLTVQPASEWMQIHFHHFRQRFLDEGRILAGLHHPGIVTVHMLFEENNTAYLVMEYIEGQSLADYLQACGGRLPIEEALDLTRQVGEALTVVHKGNHLHRDVNPNNILRRPDGQAILIDFGAARELGMGGEQNQTVLFTPGYAPPEQYGREGKRGPFTDVYALAATCYTLLTGQPPVDALSRISQVASLVAAHDVCPEVPVFLSHALTKGLELDSANRPATVPLFIASLKEPVPPPTISPAVLTPESTEITTSESIDNSSRREEPVSVQKTESQDNDPSGKKALFGCLAVLFIIILLGVLIGVTIHFARVAFYRPSNPALNNYQPKERIIQRRIPLPENLSATIKPLIFFQSSSTNEDWDAPKQYQQRFTIGSFLVYFELNMSFSSKCKTRFQIPIEYSYTDSKGKVIASENDVITVDPNTSGVKQAWGYGYTRSKWYSDVYTVHVKINGVDATEKEFIVN